MLRLSRWAQWGDLYPRLSIVFTVLILIASGGAFLWVLSHAVTGFGQAVPKLWSPLVIAFLLQMGILIVLMRLWRGVLHHMLDEYDDCRKTDLYLVYTRTWLTRYIPGRLWSIAGRSLMAERKGFPAGNVARSMVVEVFFSYGTLALLSLSVLVGVYVSGILSVVLFGVGVMVFALSTIKVYKMMLANSDATTKHAGITKIKGSVIASGIGLYMGYGFLQLIGIVLVSLAFIDIDMRIIAILAGGWGLSLTLGWLVFVVPVGIGAREGFALFFFSQVMDLATASA
ncbi:MAG: hypothetical protein MK000_09460, partial [Anaerolineales bacterium]|nr:hypothetical protein [Anaerolineales bacterium]